jgi:hypothetical protein
MLNMYTLASYNMQLMLSIIKIIQIKMQVEY